MKKISTWLFAGLASCLIGSTAAAAEPENSASARSIVARRLPSSDTDKGLELDKAKPAPVKNHPLTRALAYARQAHQYARQNVQDFTCVLVKREQVNGYLRDMQFISAMVRTEQSAGDQVTTPYGVYLEFLGPEKVKGRKVLYVAGDNEGKMLVRNGGKRFNYVTVKLDPLGETALEETPVPITDLGFDVQTASIIDLLQNDMRQDPLGKNTKVTFYKGAKVSGRPTTRISVVHEKQDAALEFHRAEVFIDNELRVPIRIEAYGWPTVAGKQPPLLAEYTYTKLQLNVGLTDADFDPAKLETKAKTR